MTVHCSATLSYHTAAVCAEQVKDGSKTRASGRAQHSVSLQGRCFDEAGLPCFNAELKKQSADSLFSVLTNSLWLRINSEEPEGPGVFCIVSSPTFSFYSDGEKFLADLYSTALLSKWW